MTKFFSKIERIAAVAIVAGLVLPQVAMAKGKKSQGGGRTQHAQRANFHRQNNHRHGNSISNFRRNTTQANGRRNETKQASGRQTQQTRRQTGSQSNLRQHNTTNQMHRHRHVQNRSGNSNLQRVARHNNHRNNHHGGHRNWFWGSNRNWNHNRHWTGHWPLYCGVNYWSKPYYRNYPAYYPTQTVFVSQPAAAQPPAEPPPAEAPPAAARVDLVLEDLRYAEPATLLVGPAYRVKFRNQGMEPVGKFRVALVAGVDGKASEDSPQAIVEVAGLDAGETGEVTIRLPGSAMKLASSGGQPTAFTHLLVAVDIEGVVSELDKSNNVAIVERTLLEAAAR